MSLKDYGLDGERLRKAIHIDTDQDYMLGDDQAFFCYVNGEYRNIDTPIGRLMHDFSCKNADEILNPILRERVRVLKETEGGRQEVCQIMENRINEEKIELAKDAIIKGDLTLEQIATVLKLPLAFVQELAKSTSTAYV